MFVPPNTWNLLITSIFWRSTPPKQGLFQSKQGAPFGFQIKVFFWWKKPRILRHPTSESAGETTHPTPNWRIWVPIRTHLIICENNEVALKFTEKRTYPAIQYNMVQPQEPTWASHLHGWQTYNPNKKQLDCCRIFLHQRTELDDVRQVLIESYNNFRPLKGYSISHTEMVCTHHPLIQVAIYTNDWQVQGSSYFLTKKHLSY